MPEVYEVTKPGFSFLCLFCKIVVYLVTESLASVSLSVCLSVCPVGILAVTNEGTACNATSVHFGPAVRRTDVLG